MKRFILVLVALLLCSGLFAENEILYQKQHKNIYDLTVVTLVKSSEDWYFITILIAENTDAVDKYIIYHSKKDVLQSLLFQFEKDNNYRERIEKMEKEESLMLFKEEPEIRDNVIFYSKHYLYIK